MQKGLAASPSWPLGTKGYVVYQGKKADFFIGDRGPGIPSNKGVMLDLDGKTFADLTGGTWDGSSLTVEGNGGAGHISVTYVVTEWGQGLGKKGTPRPFSSGAYGVEDDSPNGPVMVCPSATASPAAAVSPASPPAGDSPASPAAPGSVSPAATAAADDGASAAPGFSAVSASGPYSEPVVPCPEISAALIVCAVAAAAGRSALRRAANRRA
ncbi:hypothetical protein [Planotetraspora kaengkrachanensis]|uniref:Uncharacterized protein n=1 Tax=Planotetraspora kaengkrachanensis TaxID=575193 RepID=A0A8J3LSV9_9ACTN|nr:hypothetical protein [Planotetraspora kaengkrachanensis]GIG78147.1 hypothetical protein Pka01_12740 [Planotetraspora kaengkrachanensis]